MAKTKTGTSSKSVTKKTIKTKKSSNNSNNNGMSAGLRILLVIAQKNSMGEQAPSRKEVCDLANFVSQDSFRVTCNNLKKKGLIEHPDTSSIVLTPAGLEKVGPELAALPTTNDAIQAKIREMLPRGKAVQIFDYLLDGNARSKAEIADELGYDDVKSDSLRVFISKLSKHTEKVDGNKIRLTDKVFPFGRP